MVASAIDPAVKWFEKYAIPRLAGVIIIYLAVFSVFAGVFYFLIPPIFGEFRSFQDVFRTYESKFITGLQEFDGIPFFEFVPKSAEGFLSSGSLALSEVTGDALGILSAIFGGLMSLLVLIVVSFYLSAQENGIANFLRLVTPLEYEEYLIAIWIRSQKKMGQWLQGQLILGALVGVLVFISLTILGIKYALLFAVLAALLEVIPIIGPILAAVPAVFSAFLTGPFLGFLVILLYFVIQQLESHLIVPTVMRKTIGLNPLVVIIALLIGVKLGGILGLFLAVPVASVLVELVVDLDKNKRKGALLHETPAVKV